MPCFSSCDRNSSHSLAGEELMGRHTKSIDAGFLRSSPGIAAIVFLVGVLYFLLAEHRAHFIQALPWLIFLLCPLMHVFMHRGHTTSREDRDTGE